MIRRLLLIVATLGILFGASTQVKAEVFDPRKNPMHAALLSVHVDKCDGWVKQDMVLAYVDVLRMLETNAEARSVFSEYIRATLNALETTGQARFCMLLARRINGD